MYIYIYTCIHRFQVSSLHGPNRDADFTRKLCWTRMCVNYTYMTI